MTPRGSKHEADYLIIIIKLCFVTVVNRHLIIQGASFLHLELGHVSYVKFSFQTYLTFVLSFVLG